jgi:pimeloyl-ACP methyl ester carboxylesterase
MWTTLADHARLFAVDLPGFGASERRGDLLSPRAMGGFLARLIADVGLGQPHIVAPTSLSQDDCGFRTCDPKEDCHDV